MKFQGATFTVEPLAPRGAGTDDDLDWDVESALADGERQRREAAEFDAGVKRTLAIAAARQRLHVAELQRRLDAEDAFQRRQARQRRIEQTLVEYGQPRPLAHGGPVWGGR
jgi:hypothetical protein